MNPQIQTLIVLGGQFVGQLAFAFFTTAWLSPHDRGALSILIASATMIAVLANGGLGAEGRRRLAAEDARALERYLSGCRIANALCLVLAATIGSAVLVWTDAYMGWHSAVALSALALAQSVFLQSRAALFGLEMYRNGIATGVLASLILAAGVPVLHAADALEYGSATALYAVSYAIMAVILRSELRGMRDGERESLAQGWRLYVDSMSALPGTMGMQAIANGDRVVLGFVADPAQVAVYSVGAAFATVPALIANAGAQVLQTDAARGGAVGIRKQEHRVLGAVGGICLVVAVGAPWFVPRAFGPSYEDSVIVTQVMMVAAFFFTIQRLRLALHQGAAKHALVTRNAAIGGCMTVVLVSWLGAVFGPVGAAVAMTLVAVTTALAWTPSSIPR